MASRAGRQSSRAGSRGWARGFWVKARPASREARVRVEASSLGGGRGEGRWAGEVGEGGTGEEEGAGRSRTEAHRPAMAHADGASVARTTGRTTLGASSAGAGLEGAAGVAAEELRYGRRNDATGKRGKKLERTGIFV
jgi:hypothetical protein